MSVHYVRLMPYVCREIALPEELGTPHFPASQALQPGIMIQSLDFIGDLSHLAHKPGS
jgi:hypothetical protein